MNNISDFEAHKRDEEFDREDAKHRAPVTHAERVAFADAMMARIDEIAGLNGGESDAPPNWKCPFCGNQADEEKQVEHSKLCILPAAPECAECGGSGLLETDGGGGIAATTNCYCKED